MYAVDIKEKNMDKLELSLLSLQEQREVLKYKKKLDLTLALTSRLLQHRMIRSLGYNSAHIYRINGKPMHPDVFLNVSHDATYVVGGCSTLFPIGIDITDTTRDLSMKSFRRYFKDSEWSKIKTREDFAHFWTAKEAFSKMDGRGIELIERIEIVENQIIFDKIKQTATLQWFYPWENIVACICSNDTYINYDNLTKSNTFFS